jgi:hypothetical protein
MPPDLFALVPLKTGSCFLPRSAWTVILIFTLNAVGGVAGVRDRAQLFALRWRSNKLLAWADLEL